MHPVLGIGVVLGVLGTMMGALRAWQRLGTPRPETVRKVLHVGMGMVATSLPWIFSSALPVVVLCALAASVMLAVRLTPALRGVVCGVERESWGDVYFPVAVGVTFVAAGGVKLLYVVPILTLTLADATAALIGLRFGAHRYRATEGRKSAEGSAAFFGVTFISVLAALAVAEVDWRKTLLISATLALLVTALEAVAWRGLDNLFVPLGTFVLLKVYLGLETGQLVMRLVMATALFTLMLALRRQTTLNESALLGAAFAAYVFGAIGGWRWLVAPLTLLVSYTTLLSPRTSRNIARVHTVHGVISVAAAGLGWLFLATATGRRELFYPYTLAFACHLAIIGAARLRFDFPRLSTPVLLATCIVKSWALIFGPFLLLQGMAAWWPAAATVGPIALAAVTFYFTQPGMDDCPTDTGRWVRQGLVAGAASALGVLIQ
jgi:phytol kinase